MNPSNIIQQEVNQRTVITYQNPTMSMRPTVQRDVIDLQKVFNATEKITIGGGIIKYIQTEYSNKPQEVPNLKIQQEEGEPNDRSTIYYTHEIRSLEGIIVNKSTKSNKQKLRPFIDMDKSIGLKIALENMKFGEKATFKIPLQYQQSIQEYQFQQQPDIQIVQLQTPIQQQQAESLPPQDQIYIIEFIDYTNEKKQPTQCTFEDRLQKIQFFRTSANQDFKGDKYTEAKKQYKKIIEYCTQIPNAMRANWSDLQLSELKSETLRALINMAVCGIKVKDWSETKKDIMEALKLEPLDYKANFILARCFYEQKNYLDAKDSFNKLISTNLEDEKRLDVQDYLDKIKLKVEVGQKQFEKKVAQHIISKMSDDDPDDLLKERKIKQDLIQKAKKQNELRDQIKSGHVYDQEQLRKMKL